ncbi:hypothetical protein [Lentzea flava]|nr:hypothetical protein [Lentzea flava]
MAEHSLVLTKWNPNVVRDRTVWLDDMLAAFTKSCAGHDDLSATIFGTQCPKARSARTAAVPHTWLDAETSTVDFAGPGLTLRTGPYNGRWIAEADALGGQGYRLPRRDASAWHRRHPA